MGHVETTYILIRQGRLEINVPIEIQSSTKRDDKYPKTKLDTKLE